MAGAPKSSTLATCLAILVLLPLLASAGAPFRVCEDSKQQQVAGAGRSETQMVYNPVRREYFAVHILYEGNHTSVMGQRFDERGSRVGNHIPIFPWRADLNITRNTKQFPVVAYNNISDHYLVAWEFDYFGDGKDFDVVAHVVAGNGTPLASGPFFLASSYGREDSPHLAFSHKDNTYVLVHEVEASIHGVRGIVAQRLNETHSIGQPVTLHTPYADREPFVAYHPPSNDFLLVWEFDQTNDNKSVIGAVVLGGTPLVARSATPNVVGSTIERIGGQLTVAHDHDAQLAYSPQEDVFLLTWEVDGDSGEKEVVCSLVTPYAGATNKFKVVGNASHPYDRKPSPVYTPFTNEFFIAYESGPNPIYTGIEGVAFSANGLERRADPFAVSQDLNLEHAPTAALSSTCGAIFTLWASDTSLPTRSDYAPAPSAAKRELPVASFVQASSKERGGPIAFSVTSNNALRSKFSLGRRAPVNDEAVPHVPLLANVPAKNNNNNNNVAAQEAPPSTSSLQAILVCLPGRGACSAAGSPMPIPSKPPKDKDSDESSVMGVVLGLLGGVVVLAGLGIGGYVGWRRYPQIREWLESRRASAATGVWADESEFSISADAFTGSGEEDTAGDDEH